MNRRPSLLALVVALTAPGTGLAADADPGPDAGIATPRVSCDFLDVRNEAPHNASTAPGSAPHIRRVGGWGAIPDGAGGGFLKVGSGQAQPATLELGPRSLSVTPGTTALIEIAIDHLNRIVTPFENPVVHTVSAASTSVEGQIVYVATATEEPVALYIGDGPGGDLALSLTLAPRYVPPREIRLTVPGYRGRRAAFTGGGREGAASASLTRPLASALGGNQPYVETIADLLRAMAQRRLPTGYQVRTRPGIEARCAPGLKVLKAQLTQGPAASVLTLGLRNTGAGIRPADESACTVGQRPVAAVAAWPRNSLGPGQETQLFLVLQEDGAAPDPVGKPP